MGKREIKKMNKNLDISIIDILSEMDPTENNKFLPFLVKQLKNNLTDKKHNKHTLKGLISKVSKNINDEYYYDVYNSDEDLISEIKSVLLHYIDATKDDFNLLFKLSKYMDEKKTPNVDVLKYDNWGEIRSLVSDIDLKSKEKGLRTTTQEIYRDDEWLVVRPLSFESSSVYGSNTKWCTTMRNRREYFYRYIKGSLIYVINRKTNDKFGFYNGTFIDSNVYEVSVWDNKNERIDSIMTNIPMNILEVIRGSLNIQNYLLLSDEEKNEYNKYFTEGESLLEEEEVLTDLRVEVAQPQTYQGGY